LTAGFSGNGHLLPLARTMQRSFDRPVHFETGLILNAQISV
jgi:hypothetical protein